MIHHILQACKNVHKYEAFDSNKICFFLIGKREEDIIFIKTKITKIYENKIE